MVHIERRVTERRDADGRALRTVRYRVRYRDSSGRNHSETKTRRVDANRRKAEIEHELAAGSWHDPRRGDVLLRVWVEEWLPSRHDLRPTTWARLQTTMTHQVLPEFGDSALRKISNSDVRRWVSKLLSGGLSAATTRKAVFALCQALGCGDRGRAALAQCSRRDPIAGRAPKAPAVPIPAGGGAAGERAN